MLMHKNTYIGTSHVNHSLLVDSEGTLSIHAQQKHLFSKHLSTLRYTLGGKLLFIFKQNEVWLTGLSGPQNSVGSFAPRKCLLTVG